MEKNINKYLSLLLTQQKIEMLSIALDLKIFKLIEEDEYSYLSLSLRLGSHEENTKILLDSLVFMELLKEKDGIYINTENTKKFFVYGKESYCGDLFLYRKELLTKSNKMLKSLIIKGNKKIKDSKHPEKWAQAAKGNLKYEQKNLIAPFALEIVQNLDEYKNAEKMLDLGCSSGIVGLEFVKNHDFMKAICFDYKEVTDIVEEHINEYSLENRLSVLSGDIEEDNIGKEYDLIWCSNIFYFIKDKKLLIKKLYDSLNPNGVLITCHIEKNEKKEIDENSFLYYLFLNLQGKEYLHKKGLLKDFEEIGFKVKDSFISYDFPMTPMQIHILKK